MASQIAYYRAHAPRYDDWWRRANDHDLGEDSRLRWEAEISALRTALVTFAPLGDVVEFAGGTGNWTVELARLADSVTVVDTSTEATTIARQKVTTENVTWITEDIFTFRPNREYDTVFFSFWLSHVPNERFDQFWALVDECLSTRGRVFFVDNAHPSLERDLPELEELTRRSTDTLLAGINSVTDLTTGVSTRRAADGCTYELVKIWRTPEELESALSGLGWKVRVDTTNWAFIYGSGTRTSYDG